MKSSYLTLLFAVLKKELTVEWRTKEVLYTSLFFAVLLATVFMFGFFEGDRFSRTGGYIKLGPGVMWIGLIFAATIGFNRSFSREKESGSLEALRLIPGVHRPLFWGKCCANLIVLGLVEIILVPAVAIFFPMPLFTMLPRLAIVLFLGSVGLVALGTLLSATLVNIRLREVLMPLVLFPLIVPLLVAAVSATEQLILNNLESYWDWTFLMIAFDAIYLVMANWLAVTVLESTE